MKSRLKIFVFILAVMMLAATAVANVIADGTETLGTPLTPGTNDPLPIANGTGTVVAGTGLVTQPNSIDFAVPDGAAVKQVLLYWEGPV